jgi:hypothetical protein
MEVRMHNKKRYHVDENWLDENFNDYRHTLKALRQASDRHTRTVVVYGDQIIRVE